MIEPPLFAAIGYGLSASLWIATLIVLDGLRRCTRTGDVVGCFRVVEHAFATAIVAVLVGLVTRWITGGMA